jgi:hypothetical protein
LTHIFSQPKGTRNKFVGGVGSKFLEFWKLVICGFAPPQEVLSDVTFVFRFAIGPDPISSRPDLFAGDGMNYRIIQIRPFLRRFCTLVVVLTPRTTRVIVRI